MDLKDFVSESLKQIIDGVVDAQDHAFNAGAAVAPQRVINMEAIRLGIDDRMEQSIEFDVAVTAQESQEKQGKAGISIPYFNAGGKISAGQENSTISRIKFSVPVLFPRA